MCGLYTWSLNFRRWDLAWTVSVPPSWGLGAVEVKMTKGVKNPKIRLCSSQHSSVSGWKQCFLKPCGRYYSLSYYFCEVIQLFIFGHKS